MTSPLIAAIEGQVCVDDALARVTDVDAVLRDGRTALLAAAAVGAARTQFAETEQVHVFVRAFGAGGYDRLLAGRAPVAAKAQSRLGSIRGDWR